MLLITCTQILCKSVFPFSAVPHFHMNLHVTFGPSCVTHLWQLPMSLAALWWVRTTVAHYMRQEATQWFAGVCVCCGNTSTQLKLKEKKKKEIRQPPKSVWHNKQKQKRATSWAGVCDVVSFMATVIQKQSDVSSNSGFSLLVHFLVKAFFLTLWKRWFCPPVKHCAAVKQFNNIYYTSFIF